MNSALIVWCDKILRFGFVLLFGLVPLLLTPWNYELFEFNKMIAVYGITAIVTTSWLIKSIAQKELRIAKTPLDIPIVLFFLSQLVSAFFSIDPHVSWFGYYSRFNGGIWSVISYVLLYYAFVSNIPSSVLSDAVQSVRRLADKVKSGKPDAKNPSAHLGNQQQADRWIINLLTVSLITASIVAVYGVLERLGIDKHLWVQDVQSRVFSTLGQPNWLAAYLVALMPITWAFAFGQFMRKTEKSTRKTWLPVGIYSAVSLLLFVVLLFTRSRSGLLGFAVADAVFLGLVYLAGKKVGASISNSPSHSATENHGLALKWVGVLHAAFALIIFVNGTGTPAIDTWVTFDGLQTRITNMTKTTTQREPEATPSADTQPSQAGPALEVGGTESGTIRKHVWQGAVNAWQSSVKTKLIGTGTETFAFAFYQFRPAAHNLTSEWDFLYNKAHNEYLNYLATTGVFGLGSYLLFIGAFIIWFLRFGLRSTGSYPLPQALFAGWLSVLVTNFFGFSVVITQVFLFLFPALAILISHRDSGFRLVHLGIPFVRKWSTVLMLIILAMGSLILFGVGSFWYADSLYARGYRMSRAGLYGQAIPALTRAIAINGREPTYRDELAGNYATLSVAAFEGGNATQAAQLASLAITENNTALSISPRNINFHKTKTKVYYTLSSVEPTFNAKAVEALQHALPLSPNDPKIYYNLAILVGREGRSDEAIEYLMKAKTLKPNYRDAYYALWVFYTEANNQSGARATLTDYLENVDPNDADFRERLK